MVRYTRQRFDCYGSQKNTAAVFGKCIPIYQEAANRIGMKITGTRTCANNDVRSMTNPSA